MIPIILGGLIGSVVLYELFIKKKAAAATPPPSATTAPATATATATASIPIPSVSQTPAQVYVDPSQVYSQPMSQASPPSNPAPTTTIDPGPTQQLNLPSFNATPQPLPTVGTILGVAQSVGNSLAATAVTPAEVFATSPATIDPRSISIASMNAVASPAMAAVTPVSSSPTNSPSPVSNPTPPVQRPIGGMAGGGSNPQPATALLMGVLYNPDGSYADSIATSNAFNAVMKWLKTKGNESAYIQVPASAQKWFTSRGIAAKRVGLLT